MIKKEKMKNNLRLKTEEKTTIMRKTPRMSEEMYNKMKGLFTHILMEANDEQAQLIADCIGALADTELRRLEKEMGLDDPKNLN